MVTIQIHPAMLAATCILGESSKTCLYWRDAICPLPKLSLNRAGQLLVLGRPGQFLASLMDPPSIREFFCGLKPYLDVTKPAWEYKRVNDPYPQHFHFFSKFDFFCFGCFAQVWLRWRGWACCVWGFSTSRPFSIWQTPQPWNILHTEFDTSRFLWSTTFMWRIQIY